MIRSVSGVTLSIVTEQPERWTPYDLGAHAGQADRTGRIMTWYEKYGGRMGEPEWAA